MTVAKFDTSVVATSYGKNQIKLVISIGCVIVSRGMVFGVAKAKKRTKNTWEL